MKELDEKLNRIKEKSINTMPSTGNLHLYHYIDEALTAKEPHDTLYNFLLERNTPYMGNVALIFDNRKITYEELHTHIDEYARALYKKGVRKENTVSLGVANTPEAIYLAYALNKIGATVTPINPTYNKYKMTRDLELTKPDMFIGINDCYKTFKRASQGMDIETYIFKATESMSDKKIKVLYNIKNALTGNLSLSEKRDFIKMINEGSTYKNAVFHQYEENRISDIMFTGGTSGVHKGVDLEENALNCVVRSLDYSLNLESGEVFMANLPQFMAFGKLALHYALCKSLVLSMTVKAYPQDFVDELLRIQPAGVMGGPIHWERIIDNPKLDGKDLSFLKMAISGGEQLKRQSEIAIDRELLGHNAKTTIWNGLGMTEMWAPVAVKRGSLNTTGSIGTMLPFTKAKIMNLSTNQECNYNEEGLLYVTGPGMMLGYHNNIEEDKKVFVTDNDGTKWYCTGDIVKMSEAGELFYIGRKKRIFVCGCDNVYPEQLETLISQIPGIEEIVITKVPDNMEQFVPKAHIYIKKEHQDEETRIRKDVEKIISNTLGKGIVPRYYKFYDQPFPKTDSNKVDVKKVEEQDNLQIEQQKVLKYAK